MLERLGVGERLDVLHRAAVHHVAHRELDDLAALGARNIGDLHDFRGHVPRRRVGANVFLDTLRERIVEHESVAGVFEVVDTVDE